MPVRPVQAADRLRALVDRHPSLGVAPPVRSRDEHTLAEFADEPYRDGASLVRVAVGPDEHGADTVVVAAHHGAVDGLGLLAILGAVVGGPVTSSARGIGDRRPLTSWEASAARRVAEAVVAPPVRIAPRRGTRGARGDVLLASSVPAARAGSAELIVAATRATTAWNRAARPVVAAVGLSRRSGARLTPEPAAAFSRLRVPADADVDAVRALLAAQPPEPTPPPGGPGSSLLATVLATRLGATFLTSNLGVVDGPGLRSVAFHPVASGRSGVAIGLASTAGATTVTLRARRASFDDSAAAELLALVRAALPVPA